MKEKKKIVPNHARNCSIEERAVLARVMQPNVSLRPLSRGKREKRRKYLKSGIQNGISRQDLIGL